jgi:predicted nucleic acid-binding protein
MILVIDTCVIVSALRSRSGASRILLDQVRTQPLHLAISSGLMMEYEAVLTRPEQMAVHRQSREEIERFLRSLASFAKHVRSNYRHRPLLQDPTMKWFSKLPSTVAHKPSPPTMSGIFFPPQLFSGSKS